MAGIRVEESGGRDSISSPLANCGCGYTSADKGLYKFVNSPLGELCLKRDG